ILEKDRDEWRHVAEELNTFLVQFKNERGIRLIQKLHVLRVNWPNAFSNKLQTDSHPGAYLSLYDERCWLRLGNGSAASLIRSAANPFLLRIADLKNENKAPFDIQVNRSPLKSKQNQKYALL